jgi:hypothetical protein
MPRCTTLQRDVNVIRLGPEFIILHKHAAIKLVVTLVTLPDSSCWHAEHRLVLQSTASI